MNKPFKRLKNQACDQNKKYFKNDILLSVSYVSSQPCIYKLKLGLKILQNTKVEL